MCRFESIDDLVSASAEVISELLAFTHMTMVEGTLFRKAVELEAAGVSWHDVLAR